MLPVAAGPAVVAAAAHASLLADIGQPVSGRQKSHGSR